MVETLFSIPQNAFNLNDDDFFYFIGQFCGKDIVEYFQLLGIRSVRSLLGIDDIFLPLQQNYLELDQIKKKLAFCRSDGSCVIKIGIQHDVNKLLKSLRNALIDNHQMTTTLTSDNDMILSSDFFQQYPFLKRLIHYFITSSHNSNLTDKPFLHHFLENLLTNLPLAKSRYRYDEHVVDFALCLSILAGRNAYQFFRLNVPGILPNLTTIQTKLANEELRADEAEFRYDDMKKYMSTTNSKFAFCAEDCTTVLRKIVYDVRANSFIGFTPPLDENGLPLIRHFRTNSFEELKRWFTEEDISNFLNLHIIQSISTTNQNTHPFAFAAYGTNGKYTSLDIIRRWFTIFEKSLTHGIRIIGYSTDADPRYMSAMKLCSGFFGTLVNDPMAKHPLLFSITLPSSWSWFYLPTKQLFLSMQDSVHICTKIRNRMLSTSAVLIIGNSVVSVDYLLQLIQSQSKFKHNLVKSDICPRDKQNFRSCEKLSASLEYLKEINGSYGTVIFVTIIRCVIIAFINTSTSTSTSERIYHAWLAVFICRLWRTWLDLVPKQELYDRVSQMNNLSHETKVKLKKKNTKQSFFITSPAYICIELNAHQITYLVLLVSGNQLPPETLKVFLFNSQTCENSFRLSRSMSGTFYASVNFSIQQYLHRQEKIAMLYSIKTQTNSSLTTTKLQFPLHHKTQQNHKNSLVQPEKITEQQVEEQVNRAFDDAWKLLLPLNIKQVLNQAKITSMHHINQHIRNRFNKSSIKLDVKMSMPIDVRDIQLDSHSEESFTEEDQEDPETETNSYEDDSDIDDHDEQQNETNSADDDSDIDDDEDQQNETNSSDNNSDIENDSEDSNDTTLSSHTIDNRLRTMKGVCDTINSRLKDSYFLVNIHGKKKYLHKSTAIWYLTDEKHGLFSDRRNRVMDK